MKIAVSPENGETRPLASAALSSDARRGRADGDDPPAARARRVERGGGRGVDRAPFGVHLVVAGVFDLDRQEGAGADMQGDAVQRDAASSEALRPAPA